MKRPEGKRDIILTEGPTKLLVHNDTARIATRGATIDFNTLADLNMFAGELNIIMVDLSMEITNEGAEPSTENNQP